MLTHLHISGYALISTLDLNLGGGLTTITGETGAGKSIMLGALGLLMGARADSGKSAGRKTVVEGSFSLSEGSEVWTLLKELGIECLPDEDLILRREVSASGRSRAFVNDTPVLLPQLARIASALIDIHSQHANLQIGTPEYQLSLLDAWGQTHTLLESYRQAYHEYRRLRQTHTDLKTNRAKAREQEEFLRFRLEQLRSLATRAGEQADLEARRALLSDASRICEAIGDAVNHLQTQDSGVSDRLAVTVNSLRSAPLNLFPEGDAILPRLESLRLELTDIASTLEGYLERVEADPGELERTETRLDQLYDAQRRFGVADEAGLLALQESLEKEYASISGDSEDLRDMEKQLHDLALTLKARAVELTDARLKAAASLSEKLVGTARPLGLTNLRLAFTLSPGKMTASGADVPTLLVAFNKNQESKPLQNVASGGEISRLMLCLKALMADKLNLPTIIFDEVDTGVSGDIASRMGALMDSMGTHMQVITITHLPQVAARGSSQLKVYKADSEEATHTHVRTLSPEERVEEIAAMLSGATLTPAALENARTLLANN